MRKIIWLLGFLSMAAFAADNYAINPFADPRVVPTTPPEEDGAKSIGFYSEGCMDGGVPMSADPNTDWQCMHPERQRCFGTPDMKKFLQYLSQANGKLAVGDVAQAAGGPLIGGHESHETGLDADIRYEILPKGQTLSYQDCVDHPAVVVGVNKVNGLPNHPSLENHVVKGAWNPQLSKLLETAAEYPQTERIFVTPPVKQELCKEFANNGQYPSWLAKLRPYYGHDDHFHIRLACPPSSADCTKQKPVPINAADTTKVGCSGPDINYWTDTDPTKVKKNDKDDDPTFLGENIWDAQHPPDPKAPQKPPHWMDQVAKLPPKCKELQSRIEQQIRAGSTAVNPVANVTADH